MHSNNILINGVTKCLKGSICAITAINGDILVANIWAQNR